MTTHHTSPALQRLQAESAITQLRQRTGLIATLGSENGELKLDWVEGVARLLDHPTQLEEIEDEARALWHQGIRHLIWAGMGGSVITVRVLDQLGFCDAHNGQHIAIYPLDSTDPAALNAIVQRIASAKGLTLPSSNTTPDPTFLRDLLHDVMMVGVSMGMTSEEPITHLAWFTALLEQANLPPAEHLLVMTLPGSYLDQFAQQRQAPSRPLQPDRGTGTGGRMSAPTTRVFLFPAALYLTRLSEAPGQLRSVLQQAWHHYNLDLATAAPEQHPFVQAAAALADTSHNGACCLLLDFPKPWQALIPWIEQLMEESLGKGGKGIVVFNEQSLNPQAPAFHDTATLHVHITPSTPLPYLAAQDGPAQLAALAASFLGWQLTMALYGYLQHITFAGQPAVENYKARARALRDLPDPLQVIQDWPATFRAGPLTLLAPSDTHQGTPAEVFARALKHAVTSNQLDYLDVTINGDFPTQLRQLIATPLQQLANTLLGVPFKLRQAPADYHSTEQGEMDGLPALVSLRLLLREHEPPILGTYTDAFLRAQAVSTWQAMIEQNRPCFLLLLDTSSAEAAQPLEQFFAGVKDAIV